jgi:hypothetical protein
MRIMTGTPLVDLQERLQRYVLGDRTAVDEMLPLLEARRGSIPGERRLGIYHSAYRARLREALGTVFERTWAYLGDGAFDAQCTRQIAASRSTHPNLRDYGKTFPDLLRHTLADDPDVAELATMDWHIHTAFDAPDAAPLAADQMSTLGESEWTQVRFTFHPSVSIVLFDWNVLEVWHALDHGIRPPRARRLEVPLAHLFWRSALQVHFRTLEPAEHLILQRLIDGLRFADACEQAARDNPDAVRQVGSWLGRWLADELLCGIATGPSYTGAKPPPGVRKLVV